MVSVNYLRGNMQDGVSHAMRKHWRLLMFQGVVTLLLGFLAFALPVVATVVADIFVGWLFLISGIVGLLALFTSKDVPAFLWTLVTAALAMAVGVVLIWKPAEGVLTLTVLLMALFITEGIFQVVTSIAYRHMAGGAAGWMLLSGVADIVLVVLIVLGWPMTAAWTLGVLVAVNLVTSGLAVLTAAFAGRQLDKEANPAPAST